MHELLDVLILVCLGIVFAIPIFPIAAILIWVLTLVIPGFSFSWLLTGIASFIIGMIVSFVILSD